MEREIINGVEILHEPAEKYVQINDPPNDSLHGILDHIKSTYVWDNIWLCYHNNFAPQDLLKEHNATIEDDCEEIRLSVEDFEKLQMESNPPSDAGLDESAKATMIVPITVANFDIFAKLHDKVSTGTSWPSRRILEKMDLWSIFACLSPDGSNVTDFIMTMTTNGRVTTTAEIFHLYTHDLTHAKALLTAAALFSFNNGANELLYMIDKDEKICKNASETLGFKSCGFYCGYKIAASNK